MKKSLADVKDYPHSLTNRDFFIFVSPHSSGMEFIMTKIKLTRPKHVENIIIGTDSSELAEHIALFYGAYAHVSDYDATITIRENEKEAVITHPDGTAHCDDALLYLSEYLFDRTVIEDGFFALHAGAVAYNGKAYILAAPTGTGKTTLTACLTQNGFSYITDDCVIIEKSALAVHPFAKPLHLREGGVAVLNGLGLPMTGMTRITRHYVDRYVWSPEDVVTAPLPLGGIFFISRSENENRSDIMSQSERIAKLMQSPITHFTVNSDYLAFLKKLSVAGCKSIIYSDMSFVASTIKETARHG